MFVRGHVFGVEEDGGAGGGSGGNGSADDFERST